MGKLAIKGHATRGKEVIEILEMLGGINAKKNYGDNVKAVYFINTVQKNGIWCDNMYNLADYIILTLEEFLEKFPYKVGDKVCFSDNPHHYLTIMEIWWNDDCSDLECTFYEDNIDVSVSDLQPYKEETMKLSEEFFNKYCKKCGSQRCTAEGKWLEACKHYKEETMEEKTVNHIYSISECKTIGQGTFAIKIADGYKFDSIDENSNIIVKSIKFQYPKTCEECLKILGKTMNSLDNMRGYKYDIFMRLQQLLIARDAYWKIAGDWEEKRKGKVIHYVIYSTLLGEVVKDATPNSIANYLLDFPTAEMQDAFYENFKELIESCKELL